MVGAARKTLEKWITEALTDPDKDGLCTSLVLYHMEGGTNRAYVHGHKVKASNGMTPAQLQSMFHGKADTTAQDLSGAQTFNLCAFYNNREEFEAFIPFTRTGMKQSGLLTEAATDEGSLQQKMRWFENMMTQVFSRQNRQDARDERIIEQQARDNSALRQDNMAQFGLLKDMLVQMATMDHTRQIEILKFERNTKLQEQAVKLAPAVINMVTGKETLPQSTVDTSIIEAIAEKLTPENLAQFQMLAVALGLGDEEVGIIMQRFNQAIDKKAKKVEIQKNLPVSTLTPEEDMGEGSRH